MNVITSEILTRVFHIRFRESSGTAFTIDVDRRQYLVTAAHVVEGVGETGDIELMHEGRWKRLAVRVTAAIPIRADIVVLASPFQLSHTLPLELSPDGLMLGQQMYFLGFPFGMSMPDDPWGRRVPAPFAKGGINSAIVDEEGVHAIYVDAISNPGFSGGPLIFRQSHTNAMHVAGVISGNAIDRAPVVVGANDRPTPFVSHGHAGLVVAHSIEHAVAAARSNPIGFDLPQP